MKRAGKRKHSSVASVDGASSSVVAETQKKRRKQSLCTGSTKNAKKDASVRDRRKLQQRSVQDPSTSAEARPSNGNTLTGYECPICLESSRKNEMKSLPCYHAFHQRCIDTWLIENRRCPVCRQETAPPQNARPPLNNQREIIFGRLHSFPEMRLFRNNARINNDGIDMRLNNRSVRINSGGIEMRSNNGSSMRINNGGIEMRSNTGSSMILNNGGFEMRSNNGGFMFLNNGGIWMNNINF
ncbi:hypothetical protein AVEN_63156-1 [Araneus ventricosus]|uniref:RING-type domain-containing protein n=1 Tax=Araneus ventricosus TaxID=182803 RepID=A0A4Y2B106_ARAVE|nr:hypothetical protein AVEN_63156-1 [Araneus ventricosus]